MAIDITRRAMIAGLSALAGLSLAGCAWISRENIGIGDLRGRVLVEWAGPDQFVYRRSPGPPLSFRPSFMTTPIVPDDMYTTGGSIPRPLWAINGLSPWGLGPAYIIHDWIFEVHRCRRPAAAEIQNITFEQSALILAEVARALVDAGLVDGRFVDEIVWAVGSPIARSLWDRSPTAAECAVPRTLRSAVPGTLRRAAPGRIVADFIIPGPRRR
jgi:hypothetical protein